MSGDRPERNGETLQINQLMLGDAKFICDSAVHILPMSVGASIFLVIFQFTLLESNESPCTIFAQFPQISKARNTLTFCTGVSYTIASNGNVEKIGNLVYSGFKLLTQERNSLLSEILGYVPIPIYPSENRKAHSRLEREI